MNSEWFEKVIKEQIKTCEDVLIGKAKEYATDDDRLHNFKNAAGMMSCDPKEALAGMMAKHTISVYDMCRSGKDYPIELWNEKITDHINYLLLLKAIVEEDYWHETLGNEGETPVPEPIYANKMRNLAYTVRNQLKKEANPEEDHILTLAYGEVPTFDGKPVEIKEQDAYVDEVIKGFTICSNNGECKDCPYDNGYCDTCTDNLKKDAAELLETYREIVKTSFPKESNDAPKIKEDPSILDEAINSFKHTLKRCANAECELCPYYEDMKEGKTCDKGLLDEFDNIVIRLKEEHHDNT